MLRDTMGLGTNSTEIMIKHLSSLIARSLNTHYSVTESWLCTIHSSTTRLDKLKVGTLMALAMVLIVLFSLRVHQRGLLLVTTELLRLTTRLTQLCTPALIFLD